MSGLDVLGGLNACCIVVAVALHAVCIVAPKPEAWFLPPQLGSCMYCIDQAVTTSWCPVGCLPCSEQRSLEDRFAQREEELPADAAVRLHRKLVARQQQAQKQQKQLSEAELKAKEEAAMAAAEALLRSAGWASCYKCWSPAVRSKCCRRRRGGMSPGFASTWQQIALSLRSS